MKIILKGTPPSLNKFAGRQNEWQYRNEKKNWTNLVQWACKGKVPLEPPEFAFVIIRYWFKSNRRHDADNYAGKFLLDGLTKAGAIVDDDMKHCSPIPIQAGIDPKNPRTEIEVVEMLQPKFPCRRDCPNRSVTCHGECEAYLAYEAEQMKVYEARAEKARLYGGTSPAQATRFKKKQSDKKRGK